MKLYRGDSSLRKIRNRDRGRTFADSFCGNGLMSKFADGGTSSLLVGKTLFDMVLSHVGYESGQPEQSFSFRSPLLSFTEDLEEAINFVNRTGKKNLEECLLEDASYFVWELDIESFEEESAGHYKFKYKASSVNCRDFVVSQIQRGASQFQTGDGRDFAKGIMNAIVLGYADQDNRDHFAELVDVVKFVENYSHVKTDSALLVRTLERAKRSKEWLLYPTDPTEDGFGVSSRFLMNEYLKVYKCYKEVSH